MWVFINTMVTINKTCEANQTIQLHKVYSYIVYITIMTVFVYLFILTCWCYQPGSTAAINEVPIIISASFDDVKMEQYIDSKISKGLKGIKRGYVGCFYDDGRRLLKYKIRTFDVNSIHRCREHCKGYKYLGLQAGAWCLCGNHLSPSRYPKKPEHECKMKCSGNSKEICGSGWRNSIYYV